MRRPVPEVTAIGMEGPQIGSGSAVSGKTSPRWHAALTGLLPWPVVLNADVTAVP